jgi:hypothetical protein
MPDAKGKRDFLLRVTQERRLVPDSRGIAGRCAGCGRDIGQWEIDFGYAVIDSGLYCSVCIRDRYVCECGKADKHRR